MNYQSSRTTWFCVPVGSSSLSSRMKVALSPPNEARQTSQLLGRFVRCRTSCGHTVFHILHVWWLVLRRVVSHHLAIVLIIVEIFVIVVIFTVAATKATTSAVRVRLCLGQDVHGFALPPSLWRTMDMGDFLAPLRLLCDFEDRGLLTLSLTPCFCQIAAKDFGKADLTALRRLNVFPGDSLEIISLNEWLLLLLVVLVVTVLVLPWPFPSNRKVSSSYSLFLSFITSFMKLCMGSSSPAA